MKNILSSRKVNKQYLAWISWFIILSVILLAFKKFPLSSTVVGDEVGYTTEVDYLARYGAYHALSQGTSFIYSALLLVFSKLFFANYLVAARILSVMAFVVCGVLLLKCLPYCKDLTDNDRYFGLVYFGTVAGIWLWKGLPDLVSVAFLLGALYLILADRNYRYMLYAGIIIFIGFAVKPVILFAIPGIVVYLFVNGLSKATARHNFINACIFLLAFTCCFAAYHVPGFQTYHRLMLEDKNHTYEGVQRVEYKTSWNEKNAYFELYNVHNRPNKWAVSFEEVDSFKQQHPEINLKLGYGDYLKHNFGNYLSKLAGKLFLDLPVHIQHGFFFAKWTAINKVVRNLGVIRILSLFIILSMCAYERKFIAANALYLAPALIYYVILCFYSIAQLEDNWLFFCMPFLALPVVRFLNRYVNIYLLMLLQFVYLLL